MSDYDKDGNRITPYRSIHISKADKELLRTKGENRHQYRDNNGYYHLR